MCVLVMTQDGTSLDGFRLACDDRHVEAQVREEIGGLPDGMYTGEDWVESDGVTEERIRVVVHVTIEGDEICLDFRECEPQRSGACGNLVRVNTVSMCRVAFKCLLAPTVNANHGLYRPIEVLTTPGTVTHALHPAPGTPWGDMGRAVQEAIFAALAPVMPDRVIGGIYGNVQAMAIAGFDDEGTPYIHFMPYAGGWGARSSNDGVNALCPLLNGDNNNIPCEVTETEFPLMIERYAQDAVVDPNAKTSPPPAWAARVLSQLEEATISASMDRYDISPPGRFGGGDGAVNELVLEAGTPAARNRPKVSGARLRRGTVVSHRTGGGGGFGEPRERDIELIRADAGDGYVSPGAAERDYGWITDG